MIIFTCKEHEMDTLRKETIKNSLSVLKGLEENKKNSSVLGLNVSIVFPLSIFNDF